MNKVSAYLDQLPKPYVIYGMATSGSSTYKLLKAYGIIEGDILCLDDKKANKYTKDQIISQFPIGTLIVSPGISLQQPWIQSYLQKGGHLSSELEIAFSFLDTEKIICVTGSLGKSTTSALLFHSLKEFSSNPFIGGNFGTPLAEYVSDNLLHKGNISDWIILELSSYQLENFRNLKSDYSIITYLSKNHLDRYDSVSDYYNTKLILLSKTANQTICNKNGGDLFSYLSQRPLKEVIWVDRSYPLLKKLQLENSLMLGEHNLDNISTVVRFLEFIHAPESAFKSLNNFSGLEHRLEYVVKKNDIIYVNDSKATTIESVNEAISSITKKFSDKKIFLLLGGKDKELPWEKLNLSNNNIHCIFFGECGQIIKRKTTKGGSYYEKLSLLMKDLPQIVSTNSVVLLSPGGTSLDEFSSFEERGRYFKNEISKY